MRSIAVKLLQMHIPSISYNSRKVETLVNQKGTSNTYDLCSLKKDGKIYVMDNHMAAAWCWGQEVDFNLSYNLLHIDKHYDLLEGGTDLKVKTILENRFDIGNSTIGEYCSLKSEQYQVFRFDNYFTILQKLYPDLFNKKKFATHNDGTVPIDWHFYEVQIIDLPTENISYWIDSEELNWIVNIDIDYFFTKNTNDEYFQFLNDDYIICFAKQIKLSLHRIEVLTIALSPSFCGGIENAIRVSDIILDELIS